MWKVAPLINWGADVGTALMLGFAAFALSHAYLTTVFAPARRIGPDAE